MKFPFFVLNESIPVVGGEALYSYTTQTYFQYLGDMTFIFLECFSDCEFRERFAKLWSLVLLSKMWWRYLPVGWFNTCLKEKEDVG